jgi:rubrerythrin
MNLEKAIRTALEYEGRVHAVYADAMERATNEVARRVFRTLCNEEKEHLVYLGERLDEWHQTGTVTVAALDTAIPSRDDIRASVEELQGQVSAGPSGKHDAELEMLKAALQVEVETSEFYRRMVEQLDSVGRRLFQRFVEIEEGHRAIVQAEIDCVSGSGFWFDTMEFSLEH